MDPKEEIRNRLSIVDVVSSYVQLKPAGKNFKGLCPFHKDTHPSLVVSNDRGMAWCFACNSGGDIFAFVQQIENISFPEALRLLAEKANVRLPEYSPEKKEKRDRLIELLEIATKKYEHNFWNNKNAQEEVAKRKISEKTLKKYRVGFAWKGDKEMEKYLIEKGFSHKELIDVGLSTVEDKKAIKTKDKFRSRIMFPFFSNANAVLGYSGRIFGNSKPKFLNSPETALFKKSEILFGLNFARETIRKEDFCLVVEGQFDCLACADHGLQNVVAASGTAFSLSHAKQITKSSKNIVFALDSDLAGIVATKRAIEIAIFAGANVFVVPLPEGKDPDDCLQENPEEFKQRVENRQKAMDFLIDIALKDKDTSKIEDKRAILEDVFPLLSKFPGEIEKEHYLKILSEKLGTSEDSLKIEFADYKKNNTFAPQEEKSSQKPINNQKYSQLEYFIGLLVAFPEFFEEVDKSLVESLFPDGEEKTIFKKLKNHYNNTGFCTPKEVLSDDEAKKWELIALYAEEKTEHIPESLRKKELKKLIAQINNLNFIYKQKELIEQLKDCTEDNTKAKEIYMQINQLLALKKNF